MFLETLRMPSQAFNMTSAEPTRTTRDKFKEAKQVTGTPDILINPAWEGPQILNRPTYAHASKLQPLFLCLRS